EVVYARRLQPVDRASCALYLLSMVFITLLSTIVITFSALDGLYNPSIDHRDHFFCFGWSL
ncbi:hypothetical protein, partial [Bacillus sp. ISL-39]|uniref:hypothetical protein n=1 Tax=Bacillus sp. ISL-39 TaxID=2819124 RepID=UPI001BEB197B